VDSSERRELTQQVHRSTGAYELVLSPLILGLIGYALDRLFGTTPLLTIIFAVAGLIGATAKVFFTYKAEMEQHEANGPWVKRS
jgi:F0F1-type ATP synthase assembly protein I